jgi:hypothetical protein
MGILSMSVKQPSSYPHTFSVDVKRSGVTPPLPVCIRATSFNLGTQ